ncbi:putative amino acid transporter [Salmonella enterica subsp. enterica]|nr:putative amino acid transporter [Salmonella enterica subsp. enterica]
MNIRGMEWTKIINSISAWCGVFIPSAILILLAVVWLCTGHQMQTDYTTAKNWIPDLGHWDTIVFLSSMMFAFAGLEVAPMIAGRTRNPQRDFPRAMAVSAAVIVGIYMVGTWALNTLFTRRENRHRGRRHAGYACCCGHAAYAVVNSCYGHLYVFWRSRAD